ncbi:MAG: hypothetical protein AUJ98_00310 [Bacteroidetes bacterium CG2_30_33_31]|nr:MAG: hypothetical protein AUJ98_00310 [Bacteroidetes bacterium CG2_30_33_31]
MKITLFIISVFIILPISISAQMLLSNQEKVILQTDRNFFIAGENILFIAKYLNTDSSRNSKILYVDLISSEPEWIRGKKYRISDFNVSGSFKISENIKTGFYFLRAYSNSMRNLGQQNFAIIPLKIVNPFSEEVISQNITLSKSDTDTNNFTNEISISINNSDIAKDSILEIEINAKNISANNDFCLSIIPELAQQNINFQLVKSDKSKDFLMEDVGIAISGIVINKLTKLPIPSTTICLSILGSSDLIFANSDSIGQFNFNLTDNFGNQEIFVSLMDSNLANQAEIKINNDFSFAETINVQAFTLSDEEKNLALILSKNLQLTDVFKEKSTTREKFQQQFYGKADETINLLDYVGLNFLREYFTEISSSVNLKYHNKKPYFTINSTNPQLQFIPTLILLDYAPVYDLEKLLKLSTSKINRIEIVNDIYVKGEFMFGGILNIITNNYDFANFEFPKSSIFVNYEMLHEENLNKYETFDDKMPDYRNTILWQPKIAPKFPYKTTFKKPSASGKYLIIFKSVSDRKPYFEKTLEFYVD